MAASLGFVRCLKAEAGVEGAAVGRQVRFNRLDNWQAGDQLDVWITRYAGWANMYHGLQKGGLSSKKAYAAVTVSPSRSCGAESTKVQHIPIS